MCIYGDALMASHLVVGCSWDGDGVCCGLTGSADYQPSLVQCMPLPILFDCSDASYKCSTQKMGDAAWAAVDWHASVVLGPYCHFSGGYLYNAAFKALSDIPTRKN